VLKIITNDTMNFFLKQQSASMYFQTITVSECCLIKLFSYILFEKIYLYFSIGNGQPTEPALCQLYRRTLVQYRPTYGARTVIAKDSARGDRPASNCTVVKAHPCLISAVRLPL